MLIIPPAFQNPAFKGVLYKLRDLVIDTPSLLQHLISENASRIFQGNCSIQQQDHPAKDGISSIHLDNGQQDNGQQDNGQQGNGQQIEADTYIFAAGSGNEQLISSAGLPLTMQRRPLHQVMVTGDLPELHAHAITLRSADKPRITISTHPGPNTNTWYLGGMLC